MVRIRLAKYGKKHNPRYRVVVMEKRTKRNGESIEQLGHYNPTANPSEFKVNKERVEYWLSQGAQPS